MGLPGSGVNYGLRVMENDKISRDDGRVGY